MMKNAVLITLTLTTLRVAESRAHSSLQPFQMQQCKLNKKCFKITAAMAHLSVAGTTVTAKHSQILLYQNRKDEAPLTFDCDLLTYWSHSQIILCDNRNDRNKTTFVLDDGLRLQRFN